MQFIGKIPTFNCHNNGSWPTFLERLDFFFELNDFATSELRKSLILTTIGQDTFRILHDLCQPQLPVDRTLDEIIALLSEYFKKKDKLTIQQIRRERLKFFAAKQRLFETIIHWYGRVKRLSIPCHFEGADRYEMEILNRFVCGLRPKQPILSIFYDKDELVTSSEALELALERESKGQNWIILPNDEPL